MKSSLTKLWSGLEQILYFIIVKVLHLSVLDKNWEGFMQFVKFGIIGLSNTVISYILNVAVLLILSPFSVSWDFFAGNMVGFLLSVLWSFYWNNRFVFTMQEGQRRSVWKALLKTYLAYGFTGIILNNILSWLWITKFGISKFIAPVINLIVSVPLNFIINKLWAFRAE
ncbi:MAG: GtrA family protein [Firmicutes bacterium]|nr:GtrA family protein [Bacillota bacterium]MDD6695392.1 GtrA family protein [Bacillota bacterium]MDY3769430.1 GtrA family protein [Lachnospiraceae bacterium]